MGKGRAGKGRGACRLGVLFLAAAFAHATTHNDTIQIKILDSETHAVSLSGNDVPKNCDQVNFDAYCNNSQTRAVTNTLLVQEGNQPPFRVACTIDSKWSRCIPLPKGETFEAKNAKRGVVVYYIDDKGKARSQLYTLIAGGRLPDAPASEPAAAVQPRAPGGATEKSATVTRSQATPAQPLPAAAPEPGKAADAKVTCDLTSTPAGAEITLDGKYVGSTPSKIALNTGEHVVVFSLPGFAAWKRELSVSPGSQLTVSAMLQKASQ
jgi:hypothetical protein